VKKDDGNGCSNISAKWTEHSLLAAKAPPVMNPEIIAFHASSFCRHPFTAQSNVENIPPHTPKFPPVTGARAFIVEIAPTKRSPCQSNEYTERYKGCNQRTTCHWVMRSTHSGRIPCSFDSMPDTTTDSAHRKSPSKIAKDYPWTAASELVRQLHSVI